MRITIVGEKTGADAFLVFDSIGMKELQYDIFIKTPENGESKIILKDIGTGSVPKGAIRRSIPAIVVQGRMVDSRTAAIVAEFDIVHNIFKNEKELRNLKKQIPKYEYTPAYETKDYVESRGCEKRNVRYQYIDHYRRKDIRREMIVATIDQYIPAIDEIDRIKADEELDKFLTQVLDKTI